MNGTIAKNLAVAAGSIAFSLTAIVLGLKLYANWLNIHDPFFRYENQLNMWRPEPMIGFINKPNFAIYCRGNVLAQTNELGFRGIRPTSITKKNGTRRIVGLGDSVMWGSGVNEVDSFLGILERKLNESSSHEVINAGVVGYSTYQEFVYLKKFILPLEPDIVLVNYCRNDILPSENPFNNVRRIHIRYLNGILQSQDPTLTPDRRAMSEDLIRLFESAGHVWDALSEWKGKAPDRIRFTKEVLIEMPIARMAELCREADVRLIYLFIPSESGSTGYARYVTG